MSARGTAELTELMAAVTACTNVEGMAMNSLVADALIERAKQGKRVMVLSHTHQAARQAFREIADHATNADEIRRANGKERITFDNGGSIRVCSVQGNGYRGFVTDLVYVEREADALLAPAGFRDVRSLVATTGGEIVRE